MGPAPLHDGWLDLHDVRPPDRLRVEDCPEGEAETEPCNQNAQTFAALEPSQGSLGEGSLRGASPFARHEENAVFDDVVDRALTVLCDAATEGDLSPLGLNPRHHLAFVFQDGRVGVVDRGSTLGFELDGKRLGGPGGSPGPLFLEGAESTLLLGSKESPYRYRVTIGRAP